MKNHQAIEKAIEEGKAKILNLQTAKEIKGKKIQTKYFGYNDQDGTDEFIVGRLVLAHTLWVNNDPNHHKDKAANSPREYFDKLTLLDSEGKPTHVNGYTDEDFMWCSDSDRPLHFIVIE